MTKLENKNGITVRQLKELVKDLPEVNDTWNEPFELWVDIGNGLSKPITSIWPLNKNEDGCDLIFK